MVTEKVGLQKMSANIGKTTLPIFANIGRGCFANICRYLLLMDRQTKIGSNIGSNIGKYQLDRTGLNIQNATETIKTIILGKKSLQEEIFISTE